MKCIKNTIRNISTEGIGILFIVIAVVNVLLFCFADGIAGNDFWWHIKVGEWILENRQIPISDIFSWYGTQNQLPWTAHEWLSDVIYFVIYAVFDELGVFLFSVAAAMGMALLMLHHVKRI